MNRTNFQRYLDENYQKHSETWKNELINIDWGGDFSIADGEAFYRATTDKSVAGWAISTELKTRHNALKKIIDSV